MLARTTTGFENRITGIAVEFIPSQAGVAAVVCVSFVIIRNLRITRKPAFFGINKDGLEIQGRSGRKGFLWPLL